MDFSTKAGWQKFLITLIGIIGTVALGFGFSQAKIESITATATTLVPIIATIGFWIVNQVAAKGKAKTVVELATIEANKVIAAKSTPTVISPGTAGATIGSIQATGNASTFDRAKFDSTVKKFAAMNLATNDGSATSLAMAAETAYTGLGTNNNQATILDAVKAMIDYDESWFKELFFGDKDFKCVDAEGNPVSPIEYVRLHLNDKNAGCPTCGKDIQACQPKTVQQLVDYAGKTSYGYAYKVLSNRYAQREQLEAALA